MGVIPLIRQVVLGVTTLFSLIVLAISAHLISETQQYFNVTATFTALALAVALISLLTLPVMLVVDILRRGVFTSLVIVEVVWLSVLCVLWIAAAGESVSGYDLSFALGCNYVNTIYNGMCQETQAIEAFSFLNFIILLVYAGFLTVMSVIAASRGQNVWMLSVKESFGSPAEPVQHPMTNYNAPAAAPMQYAAGPAPPVATPSPAVPV